MANLLSVIPDFQVQNYTHILPSLERALVTIVDILTLPAIEVAKRAQVPPSEVKKLSDALLEALHSDIGGGSTADQIVNSKLIAGRPAGEPTPNEPWSTISTLDDRLDATLGGGVASGYLTEVVGESAVGKTQFLLSLLLSVQIPRPSGLGKSALYISTEAPLQTTRLTQILNAHPKLCQLPESERPTLARIHSTHIHDVEAQEHIIRYQVPVAIKRQNIGLLVIDSIAANYRAEFDRSKARKGAESFAKRSNQLSQLGALLRDIARNSNIAIVVANQVADRFAAVEPSSQAHQVSQSTQRSRRDSPPQSRGNDAAQFSQNGTLQPSTIPQMLSTDDPLALDHQQRFFTGWGDDLEASNLKTPSLGLTWTNQLATRIALLKQPVYEDKAYQPGEDRNICGWKRTAKTVFSAWCGESSISFEIWEGGIRVNGEKTDPNG